MGAYFPMKANEVTLSDSDPNVFDGFIPAIDGNVEIWNRSGEAVTVPVLGGHVYMLGTTRILSSGTTAGPIIGLTP